MRRLVKIIATVGPASDPILEELANRVDCIRVNFSHGSRAENGKRIERVKECAEVPIMLDTAGPELRVEKEVEVKANEPFKLSIIPKIKLVDGDVVLIDDGRIEVVYEEGYFKSKYDVKIRRGAKVTIKGRDIPLPTLTKKDLEDIKFGVKKGIDIVALSFVRSVEDVIELKEYLDDLGAKDVWIVTKIEHPKALDDLWRIIKFSDGVMVARGDLGVGLPFQKVPAIQKRIVDLSIELGKTVIIATQLLASMVKEPNPTRAEVSDVFNSVLSGADALMLSNETAVGKHPLRAVEVLDKIIKEAQKHVRVDPKPLDFGELMGRAGVKVAEYVKGTIICSTEDGETVKKIAKFKPFAEIIYKCENERIRKNLKIVWGAYPEGEPEGYIVEISTLPYKPKIEVYRTRDVICIGKGIGSGKVEGVVGVDIRIAEKGEVVEAPAVLYYGGIKDRAIAEYIKKNIPVFLPAKRIKRGEPVVIDFDTGLIFYRRKEKYEELYTGAYE